MLKIRVRESKPDLIEFFKTVMDGSDKSLHFFIDPKTEEIFISIFDGNYRTFTLDKEASEELLGALSSTIG